MKRRSGEKEALWRRVVAEQVKSGKSVREFCKQQDLHESQFYAWRREIALRDRESIELRQAVPQFLPVQVIRGEANTSDCPIEVVSPDGWRVLFLCVQPGRGKTLWIDEQSQPAWVRRDLQQENGFWNPSFLGRFSGHERGSVAGGSRGT